MREQGYANKKLQLLTDITGAFRPGILTALMGVSGAGKTTLLDVLAGRKTSGYIEGDIRISGFPKVQETFARVSGYCEQTDIHSPNITVEESVIYSAWLRLAPEIESATKTVTSLSLFPHTQIKEQFDTNLKPIFTGIREASAGDDRVRRDQGCFGGSRRRERIIDGAEETAYDRGGVGGESVDHLHGRAYDGTRRKSSRHCYESCEERS